jgi:hypothetical protein
VSGVASAKQAPWFTPVFAYFALPPIIGFAMAHSGSGDVRYLRDLCSKIREIREIRG